MVPDITLTDIPAVWWEPNNDWGAPAMTQVASYQAAVITQRAAYEAAELRDAARREADQLMRRTVAQASAVREAAEMEAAEVRQAVLLMQTELTDLATRITTTLPNPVLPRTSPADRPPTERPPASPSGQPKARPRTVPAAKPASRHAARPAGKPAQAAPGQGRQAGSMRFAVAASSALLLVAAVAGATEIYLHGFAFFVFRSVGTGETGRGPGGLTEDQGPGLPGAPKAAAAHVKAPPIRRATIAVHHG